MAKSVLFGIICLQAINGTKNLFSISQVQFNNHPFTSDVGKLFRRFSGLGAIFLLPLPLILFVLTVSLTLRLIGNRIQYLFVANKTSSAINLLQKRFCLQ